MDLFYSGTQGICPVSVVFKYHSSNIVLFHAVSHNFQQTRPPLIM